MQSICTHWKESLGYRQTPLLKFIEMHLTLLKKIYLKISDTKLLGKLHTFLRLFFSVLIKCFKALISFKIWRWCSYFYSTSSDLSGGVLLMKAERMKPPITLPCDILSSLCSESGVLTGWNSTGRFLLGFEFIHVYACTPDWHLLLNSRETMGMGLFILWSPQTYSKWDQVCATVIDPYECKAEEFLALK